MHVILGGPRKDLRLSHKVIYHTGSGHDMPQGWWARYRGWGGYTDHARLEEDEASGTDRLHPVDHCIAPEHPRKQPRVAREKT